MKLTHARVTKYRSIDDSTEVPIEDDITAFIGRNESGKTAFLEALRRINPADGARLDVVVDYPRSQLAAYRRRHDQRPDTVVAARFELAPEDIAEVERRFGKGILKSHSVLVRRDYKGQLAVDLAVDEVMLLTQLVDKRTDLSDVAREVALAASSFSDLVDRLEPFAPDNRGAAVLLQVAQQVRANPLERRIWNEALATRLPRFISFTDADVMPSAVAVSDLIDPASRHRPGISTVLALLDLAGVDPAELVPGAQSYEELRARIEDAALSVTDELVTYWTHDPDIDVMIDVAQAGPRDPGFPIGTPVLRIRVGNRRRRISLPLGERSRGFAWFFSFLVRHCQLGEYASPIILLLDEPGLSLHAGAQLDFLRFLEERLSAGHQVLYTTHSPYLLDPTRLDRARGVSHSADKGTRVTADLGQVDEHTLLPLRAALASSLAEKIAPKPPALCVRDVSDLVLLRAMSSEVERRGKRGLDPRLKVVPMGGMAHLIPWLMTSRQKGEGIILLHDTEPRERASPDLLLKLARSSLARGLKVVSLAPLTGSPGGEVGHLEDLLDLPLWLSLVTEAHKLSPPLAEDELGDQGGIIARTHKGLAGSGEHLDRMRVAEVLIRRGNTPLPPATIERFARLIESINSAI